MIFPRSLLVATRKREGVHTLPYCCTVDTNRHQMKIRSPEMHYKHCAKYRIVCVHVLVSGRPLWYRKNRKTENRSSPLWCKNPHKALASLFCPKACPDSEKNELFAQSKSSLATSPRLTGYGSRQNLEGVCSSTLRVIAAKFEGRRWSVPRGLAWDEGAQAISVAFFPDGNNLCCIAKKRVRPPGLKRNLETQDDPRPSLGSEDYAQ